MGTRPPFHSSESIFPVCLLRRQQGVLPGQLPSKCHGNRHHSLQLSTLPLGHLHGDRLDGEAAGGAVEDAPASSGGRGCAGDGRAPPHTPPPPGVRSRRAPQPGPLAQALRICQPVRPSGARLAGAAWRGRHCSAGRGPGASVFWSCCCWAYFGRPPLSAHGR